MSSYAGQASCTVLYLARRRRKERSNFLLISIVAGQSHPSGSASDGSQAGQPFKESFFYTKQPDLDLCLRSGLT